MSKLTRHQRYLTTKIDKSKRILKLFYDRNDLYTSISDCLADMMHLAAALDYDFTEALEDAHLHYSAEQSNDELTQDESI